MRKSGESIGIQVGASETAVSAARVAIMQIIECVVADAVKVEALLTLRTVCKVEHTTITNCTIYGGEKP
jgi:hypothetical protein